MIPSTEQEVEPILNTWPFNKIILLDPIYKNPAIQTDGEYLLFVPTFNSLREASGMELSFRKAWLISIESELSFEPIVSIRSLNLPTPDGNAVLLVECSKRQIIIVDDNFCEI